LQGLSSEQLKAAEGWYPHANEEAQRLATTYGTTIEQAAGVIAAMSPQMDWDDNVRDAERLMAYYATMRNEAWSPQEFDAQLRASVGLKVDDKDTPNYDESDLYTMKGMGIAALSDNTSKAFEILQGDNPEATLSGMKVCSFYDNIMDPGGTREVTVDGHMLKVYAYSSGLSQSDTTKLFSAGSEKIGTQFGSAGYITVADAVRSVADEMGMSPDAVQAAYWLQVRDTTPPTWEKTK